MKKLYPEVFLLPAVLLYGVSGGLAAGATDNINISTSIVANCLVGLQDMNFGDFDPSGSAPNLEAEGRITMNCTDNASYTIRLQPGARPGASGTQREMALVGGTDPSVFVVYQLYSDDQRTQVWGDGSTVGFTNVVTGTGTGSQQPIPVYGLIRSGQDLLVAGTYTDTVSVSVSF